MVVDDKTLDSSSVDQNETPEQAPQIEAGGDGNLNGNGNGNGNGNRDTISGDDEPVGYGLPPKKYQFKKGQSGNPRGRRKGARGLRTIIRDELNARVRIQEGGKARTVTKLELMVKRLTEKGSKGDFKAIAKIIELGERAVGFEDSSGAANRLSPQDQAIIDELLNRQAREQEFAAARKLSARPPGAQDVSSQDQPDDV